MTSIEDQVGEALRRSAESVEVVVRLDQVKSGRLDDDNRRGPMQIAMIAATVAIIGGGLGALALVAREDSSPSDNVTTPGPTLDSASVQSEPSDTSASSSTVVSSALSTTTSPMSADDQLGVDGPVIRHRDHQLGLSEGPPGTSLLAQLSGTLELENGCLYIRREERYLVVWPTGTRWDPVGSAVVISDGRSIAIGSDFAGIGGYLSMADLERLVGAEGTELAARCVDGASEEIAVTNNANAAIL